MTTLSSFCLSYRVGDIGELGISVYRYYCVWFSGLVCLAAADDDDATIYGNRWNAEICKQRHMFNIIDLFATNKIECNAEKEVPCAAPFTSKRDLDKVQMT